MKIIKQLIIGVVLAGLFACAKRPFREITEGVYRVKGEVFLVATMHHLFTEEEPTDSFYKNILGNWRDTLIWMQKHRFRKPLVINVSGPVVRKLSWLEDNEFHLSRLITDEPKKLNARQIDYLRGRYNIGSSTPELLKAQILEGLSWLGEDLKNNSFIQTLTDAEAYTEEDKTELTDFLKDKIKEFGVMLKSMLDSENVQEATTSLSYAYTDLLDNERIKVQILESMVNYKRWRGKFPEGYVPRGGFLNQRAVSELEKTSINWVTVISTGSRNYVPAQPQFIYIDELYGKPSLARVSRHLARLPGAVIIKFEDLLSFLESDNLSLLDFDGFARRISRGEDIAAVKLSSAAFTPATLELDASMLEIKRFLQDIQGVMHKYRNSGRASIDTLMEIRKKILIAEAGELCVNYANPQYDKMFRKSLVDIYHAMEISPPVELFTSLVNIEPYMPDEEMGTMLTVKCDGIIDSGEWVGAYRIFPSSPQIKELAYVYDHENIYFMVRASTADMDTAGVYLGHMNVRAASLCPRDSGDILNFPLCLEVMWRKKVPEKTVIYRTTGREAWEPLTGNYDVGYSSGVLEFAVPFRYLAVRPKKKIFVKFFMDDEKFPTDTYLTLTAPDREAARGIISYIDPAGDGSGPGNYKYPEDAEEHKGNFDLRKIEVDEKYSEKIVSLEFSALDNPYSAPLGFSPAIIDVYIDVNGRPGLGNTRLLDGRNGYVSPIDGWEYCVSVSGWEKAVYNTAGRKIGEPELSVSPMSRTINIFIPEKLISASVDNWGVVPVVLAGDSRGRLLEIKPDSGENDDQFRGRKTYSDTNILDAILPTGFSQKTVLGANRRGGAVELPALRKE